jgi:hypothetical protein
MPRAPRTHRADWTHGRTHGDPPAGYDSPMHMWTEKLSGSDRALRRHETSLARGRGGRSDEGRQFHGKSRALSSSSTAVVMDLRIASTFGELVTRAQITRDDRARRTSRVSPRSGRSCYTPVTRGVRSQLCTTHSMRSLADYLAIMDAHFSPNHRVMIDAHFSPIMTHAACVGASTITGMIDASATRTPSMPYTRRSASTTASRSDAGPMRHVPAA